MRLPIKALKDLANKYRYDVVVIYAFQTHNLSSHVATWGRTIKLCDQAAQWGNMLKDALGWPESLHAEPNRVKKLQETITNQAAIGDLMSNVFFNWTQQERFTPEERNMMKKLQEQWDSLPRK